MPFNTNNLEHVKGKDMESVETEMRKQLTK